MNLSKFYPSLLKDKIKYIYVHEIADDDDLPPSHRHLPDGTYDLILNLGNPIYLLNSRCQLKKRPDFILIGGYRKHFYLKYPAGTLLIGVVFCPGAVSALIGDRTGEIEGFVNAELIFGRSIYQVVDHLSEVSDNYSRALILEQYLADQFKGEMNHNVCRIRHALGVIHGFTGKIRIGELAREVCMSERNFRRQFTELTGYAPHEMIRIRRVKQLAHILKKGLSMRKASRILGYYDTSHLIRDFQYVVGQTPLEYVQNLDDIDRAFFRQSEYADAQLTA